MDALQVAQLVQAMAAAARPEALTQVLLEEAVRTNALQGAACYRCNEVGDCLLPLAGIAPSCSLPSLDVSELDNPVIFGLRSGQPYLVESVAHLVGVGGTFDALRECWPRATALLTLPLRNGQQDKVGSLVFLGAGLALRTLRTDALWHVLFDIHEHLFARLIDRISREEGIRYESAVRRKLEAEQGRDKVARLLASEFVGDSAMAQQTRSSMLRLADSSLSVLITGETGSGKDHAAWLIHQASARSGPFVPVNCAAIPKDLIEAELFGSARGAYTGATQARQGLVADAHGGTLFLDEIGDMPLPLQGVLLRVLNEKKYRPVGATRERESDFRLICATHQTLPERIREGLFREDLYYRIRQQSLHLSPLRERAEDIPIIATRVLLQYNRAQQAHVAGFSPAAVLWLSGQAFPGNVRELRNLVMAAAEQTAPGEAIDIETLHALTASLNSPAPRNGQAPNHSTPVDRLLAIPHLSDAVDAFERLLIGDRLRQLNGSRSQAAQSLGMPKRTLAYKCRRWNLDRKADAL